MKLRKCLENPGVRISEGVFSEMWHTAKQIITTGNILLDLGEAPARYRLCTSGDQTPTN